ncbi:hypothetical protein Gotri_019218 [Gossypium trilobum]|uniref:Transmembrane protein n=1 Tax=Gossypium trilobum TaxID=34281 RepID=A0A7J9EC56_9ROSI|nr:hypothetical protein [Gossypium trilobum]
MSSSTNKKSSGQRSVVYCHCKLTAPVYNANTLKNKGRKFFGFSKFKEIEGCDFFRSVEGDSEGMDSTVKEEGCKINEIMLENKRLLIENNRLRLEDDELNINETRWRVIRLEEKIKLYKDKMSKNNKLVVSYKLLLIVSWMVSFGYLASGW